MRVIRPAASVVTSTAVAHPIINVPFRTQLQRPDLTIETHGAGLNSMEPGFGSNMFNNYRPSAPPADLAFTNVGEGLGTSASDPYTHTMPNVETRPPVSSVSSRFSTDNLHLSPEALRSLPVTHKRMSQWIANGHLKTYIDTYLILHLPAPMSFSTAVGNINSFNESGIREIAQAAEIQQDVLQALWKKACSAFFEIPTCYFNPKLFVEKLAECKRQCIAVLEKELKEAAVITGEVLEVPQEAIDCLENQIKVSIHQRNELIHSELSAICNNAAFLDDGNAVWRSLFYHFEKNKAQLFANDVNGLLQTKYEWFTSHGRDAPNVTPQVAIYIILASISISSSAAASDPSYYDGLTLGESERRHIQRMSAPFSYCTAEEKHAAIRGALGGLLMKPNKTLLASLRKHNYNKEGDVIAMVLATDNSDVAIMEAEIAPLIPAFADARGAQAVFSSLSRRGKAEEMAIRNALGLTKTEQLANLTSNDWRNEYITCATRLLSSKDPAVISIFITAIKTTLAGDGGKMSQGIASEIFVKELQEVMDRRAASQLRKDKCILEMKRELLAYENIDRTIGVLLDCDADLTSLHNINKDSQAKLFSSDMNKSVSDSLLEEALTTVARENPHWIRSKLLQDQEADTRDKLPTLLNVFNIFLRLTYVPQAAHAMLKQHFRSRIGEVGTKAHQHNIPVEFGQVETFDVKEYKRYDPQGWYQRMQDVYHRNVSVKVRMEDLRSVDATGTKPFADIQTERRLRILAGDKVGMGILKLDSDKYEDASDNKIQGTMKLQQLISDAKKTELGKEYWPTVEVKVRRTSGQTRALQSLIDYDRVENRSKELYIKYKALKKKSLFVSPTELYIADATANRENVAVGGNNISDDGYVLSGFEPSSNIE
eukprot:Tbor_TRINITY_DN5784_c1_g4::TRINITY_DN5784_c1_g4_i1::g.19778::m.19778